MNSASKYPAFHLLPSVQKVDLTSLTRAVRLAEVRCADLNAEFHRACLDGATVEVLAGIQTACTAARMDHYLALCTHFAAAQS